MEYWPRIFVSLALLFAVRRARVADLPKIVESLAKALEASSILGWAVAACVLLFSLITIAFLLWWYHREFDRVAGQRDKLQEELMQQKVQRSTLP